MPETLTESFLPERKIRTLKSRESFLIVCEGKETEKIYFSELKKHLRAKPIQVISSDKPQAMKVVEYTIKYIENNGPSDNVWCVFDKDNLSESQFNDALALAHRNGFNVAYSNVAFELWYVLHFNGSVGAVNKGEYSRILTRHLNETYDKTKNYHKKLIPLQGTAIKNAENYLRHFSSPAFDPFNDNPSTTVVNLVKELNRVFGEDILATVDGI